MRLAWHRWLSRTLYSCVYLTLLLLLLPHTGYANADKCATCKDITENIKEGITNTAKSNFGGGNTKWEEKLGSFAFSETRLVEILEHVCTDSSKECHSMLEKYEENLETWWFKVYAKGKNKELFNYLCIEDIKVCCLNGTFGPDCKDCDGGKERPCTGNGKCGGDGTREGTGECNCDAGYQGELCDECKDKFYEESKNDTHTVCKACHEACESSCWEAGPIGCDDCKKGWTQVEDEGCQDINECEEEEICETHQYCINTQGSYKCSACHKSCSGCTSGGLFDCTECSVSHFRDGQQCTACHQACVSSCTDTTASTCDDCAEGWVLAEGVCTDLNECETSGHDCDEDEYCVNNDGSYKCLTCHYACEGCTGPDANKCKMCKDGFQLDDEGFCVDLDECDLPDVCPGLYSLCTNSAGSYKCGCQQGYHFNTDSQCVKKPKDKKKNNKPKKPKKPKDKKVEEDEKFPPVPDLDSDDLVTMEGSFDTASPEGSSSDSIGGSTDTKHSQSHQDSSKQTTDNTDGVGTSSEDNSREEL